MTEYLNIAGDNLAYEVSGRGPLVVLAQVMVRGSLASWKKYLRAEGEKIIADLPVGLGELAVLDGTGHYPHAQTPDQVLALARPFLDKTPADA